MGATVMIKNYSDAFAVIESIINEEISEDDFRACWSKNRLQGKNDSSRVCARSLRQCEGFGGASSSSQTRSSNHSSQADGLGDKGRSHRPGVIGTSRLSKYSSSTSFAESLSLVKSSNK